MRSVVIAAGGTGGHVFPGLALADALKGEANVTSVFVGTARGFEGRLVSAAGHELELFNVEPIKGGGIAQALRGGWSAARALESATAFLRRRRPGVVVSIGGYASGPVSLAAAMLGIPVAIVEPNSVVGLANRILAPFARRGYVAWEETARRVGTRKARVFGVPLRSGFGPRPYEPRGTARVLVLGGSQGASALNERVPEALGRVAKKYPLEVVHQAGRDRVAQVADAFARAGIEHARVTPFLDDVPGEMGLADLIIARSGASTVAEIAAIGRASILIPFPHAADDHQAKNARALERTGGAVCIEQESADAARIAREVERLLGDPALRTRMADAARSRGQPHAAERIARDLLALAGIPLAPRPAAAPSKANGRSSPMEVS